MLRKTLQVAKACSDVFIMYARIVMFFITKILGEEIVFKFFLPSCKNFLFCKVQNLFDSRKNVYYKFFHNL